MRGRAGALVPILAIAACGDGPTTNGAWLARDSAGVRIVESTVPAAAGEAGWRLSAEPDVQIGTVEGADAYQFEHVGDVALLGSGEILVADGGSNEIRVFDAAGRHARTFGGRGGGPGEFDFLGDVQLLPADSILVVDYNAYRVSLFGADGSLAASSPIENPSRIPGARLPDGRFWRMITLRATGDLALGPHRDSIGLVAHGLNDAAEDTLVRLPGHEVLFIESGAAGGPARIAAIPRPFGLRQLVVFKGDTLIHGDGAAPQVTVRDPGGRPVRILRWSQPAAALTPELRERYRTERLAYVRNEQQRRTLDLRMDHLPERVPAFDQLLTASDGHVWLRRYMLPGDSTSTWTVLAPAGPWQADVVLPPRFDPLHIVGDRMAGRWRDEHDVQYVRVYRILTGPT